MMDNFDVHNLSNLDFIGNLVRNLDIAQQFRFFDEPLGRMVKQKNYAEVHEYLTNNKEKVNCAMGFGPADTDCYGNVRAHSHNI